MLIRLLELNYGKDDPYTDAKYLAGFYEKNYGEFVRMIREMKNNGEEYQLSVKDDWYTLDSYVFNFPENSDMLPCVDVYVV